MRNSVKLTIGVVPLLLVFFVNSKPVLTQGTQPRAVYIQFDPLVIRSDRTQPVILQAKVFGSATRVVFEYNTNPSPFQQPGTDFEMRDDGMAGDKNSGDGIYSLTLEAPQITAGLQPADVFRRFIGFLELFQGSTLTFRGNILAEIVTDQIPSLPISRDAQDFQHTPYLVNIVDPGLKTSSPSSTVFLTRVTKRFYQVFQDDYDFLNIVSIPSYFLNRGHLVVKNDVSGIGLSLSDLSATYGSSGTLKGITIFPNTSFFDLSSGSYSHELGHQWINYLNIPPLSSGIPHWPLSDLATGIMGWSLGGPGGEGVVFPCKLVPEVGGIRLLPPNNCGCFQDLELYLMGLVPPEGVGEHLVFADQDQARTLVCNGQLFTGPVVKITIDDILGTFGRRSPDASASPKVFRVATIIASTDGLLSEEEMAFYSLFAQRAEEDRPVAIHEGFAVGTANPFALTVGRRASLIARLVNNISSGFTLSTDTSTVNGERGTKVRVAIKINRIGEFTGAVTVVPPEPSLGIKPKPLDPITTTDETVTFKLKIGAGATEGPHQLAFTGRDSSGNTSSTTLTVIVQ